MLKNPYLCAPFHKLLGVPNSEAVVASLEQIARALVPYEAGAFINPEGLIHVLDNIADDPKTDFKLARADHRYLRPGNIFWHSHPHGPLYPTLTDQTRQLASGVGWAITARDLEADAWEFFCWGDQLAIPALKGRPFRHFVADCYTIIRHEFKGRGIVLPERPRPYEWWRGEGPNVIEGLLSELNLVIYKPGELHPMPGDVALMSIDVRPRGTVNHLGVLLPDMRIAHHISDRLSATDPAEDWLRFIVGWVRYAA